MSFWMRLRVFNKWPMITSFTSNDMDSQMRSLHQKQLKESSVSACLRLTARKLMDVLDISHGSHVTTFRDHLNIGEVSANWVSRLLTIVPKNKWVITLIKYLAVFRCNRNEFLRRFVTVDEIWVHHSIRKTKQLTKLRVSPHESSPKNDKEAFQPPKSGLQFYGMSVI